MYHPATVQCDVCEKIHEKSNGWYTVRILDGTSDEFSESMIQILAYQDKDAEDFPAVCGDGCLSKFISQKATNLHSTRTI